MEINKNIDQAKILLNYYRHIIPDSVIYILGEMYRERFEDLNQFSINCPIETAFYNLFYFVNHFVSIDIQNFMSEIKNMLYTKKYPFGIIFHKNSSADFNLVFRRNSKSCTYVLYTFAGDMKIVDNYELEQFLGEGMVGWYVIIPPKKRMAYSATLDLVFYKSARYLFDNIKRSIKVERKSLSTYYLSSFASRACEMHGYNNEFGVEHIKYYIDFLCHYNNYQKSDVISSNINKLQVYIRGINSSSTEEISYVNVFDDLSKYATKVIEKY